MLGWKHPSSDHLIIYQCFPQLLRFLVPVALLGAPRAVCVARCEEAIDAQGRRTCLCHLGGFGESLETAMENDETYPLVMTNSLLLKMAIEIVDFPINSMVDLSIAMLNYQRVYDSWLWKMVIGGSVNHRVIPVTCCAVSATETWWDMKLPATVWRQQQELGRSQESWEYSEDKWTRMENIGKYLQQWDSIRFWRIRAATKTGTGIFPSKTC